ncbi:hypothetical protein LEP1GSC043_0720 [Leptospira weilii str. Ecochallenge]|uniref:Uncharacterized protein n=1 Tax=Leptospira weilii str. Ecochallenge TaxID=1049986 RepID=N1U9B6_9LEPT|nr:hypothetical protein LEP1GSC043_0720 [Leptospira weilii str. Ecochallenge]
MIDLFLVLFFVGISKEIKRRTKVVGAFPDGKSALMLEPVSKLLVL